MSDLASDDRATRLIHGYFEHTLADADYADLAALIRTDSSVAAAFARWSMSTSHLLEVRPDVDIAAKPVLGSIRTRVPVSRWSVWNPRLQFAAAAVLLLAAVVVIYVYSRTPDAGPQVRRSTPVAMVLETAEGTLVVNDTIASEGDEIASGPVFLDRGSAEFRLTNGANVTLSGQTHLTVHDPMHATLTRGSATFDCPPTAVGFTVHLPGGTRVIDLGTRFQVNIADEGRIWVAVREGRVVLRLADGTEHAVTSGQAASIDDPANPRIVATMGVLNVCWQSGTDVPEMSGPGAAPDAPEHKHWNNLPLETIGHAEAFTSLRGSDDSPSHVVIEFPEPVNSWNPEGHTGLALFAGHLNGPEDGSPRTVRLRGLRVEPGVEYDLYIYSARSINPLTTRFIVADQDATLSGDGPTDRPVQGRNYHVFRHLRPTAAGTIEITVSGAEGGMFNGFQLVERIDTPFIPDTGKEQSK